MRRSFIVGIGIGLITVLIAALAFALHSGSGHRVAAGPPATVTSAFTTCGLPGLASPNNGVQAAWEGGFTRSGQSVADAVVLSWAGNGCVGGAGSGHFQASITDSLNSPSTVGTLDVVRSGGTGGTAVQITATITAAVSGGKFQGQIEFLNHNSGTAPVGFTAMNSTRPSGAVIGSGTSFDSTNMGTGTAQARLYYPYDYYCDWAHGSTTAGSGTTYGDGSGTAHPTCANVQKTGSVGANAIQDLVFPGVAIGAAATTTGTFIVADTHHLQDVWVQPDNSNNVEIIFPRQSDYNTDYKANARDAWGSGNYNADVTNNNLVLTSGQADSQKIDIGTFSAIQTARGFTQSTTTVPTGKITQIPSTGWQCTSSSCQLSSAQNSAIEAQVKRGGFGSVILRNDGSVTDMQNEIAPYHADGIKTYEYAYLGAFFDDDAPSGPNHTAITNYSLPDSSNATYPYYHPYNAPGWNYVDIRQPGARTAWESEIDKFVCPSVYNGTNYPAGSECLAWYNGNGHVTGAGFDGIYLDGADLMTTSNGFVGGPSSDASVSGRSSFVSDCDGSVYTTCPTNGAWAESFHYALYKLLSDIRTQHPGTIIGFTGNYMMDYMWQGDFFGPESFGDGWYSGGPDNCDTSTNPGNCDLADNPRIRSNSLFDLTTIQKDRRQFLYSTYPPPHLMLGMKGPNPLFDNSAFNDGFAKVGLNPDLQYEDLGNFDGTYVTPPAYETNPDPEDHANSGLPSGQTPGYVDSYALALGNVGFNTCSGCARIVKSSTVANDTVRMYSDGTSLEYVPSCTTPCSQTYNFSRAIEAWDWHNGQVVPTTGPATTLSMAYSGSDTAPWYYSIAERYSGVSTWYWTGYGFAYKDSGTWLQGPFTIDAAPSGSSLPYTFNVSVGIQHRSGPIGTGASAQWTNVPDAPSVMTLHLPAKPTSITDNGATVPTSGAGSWSWNATTKNVTWTIPVTTTTDHTIVVS